MSEIVSRKCGCCGAEFDTELPPVSEKKGEFFDLDQRPPQPMRSVIYRQIFHCPECGFCFGPKNRQVDREFVESEEYKSCEGRQLSEGAGAYYYRLGMVSFKDRDYLNAFEAFLRAAWIFDDLGQAEFAAKCRGRCIEMNDIFPPTNAYESLIRADIFRRAGRYDEFPASLKNKHYPDEISNMVMRFEAELAKSGDCAAYTLEDCFNKYLNEKN